MTGGFASAQKEKVLNIYNWSDYIAPDTIENFTKETGIAVTYDVYDGNEILEAKLLAGHSGYDIVCPRPARSWPGRSRPAPTGRSTRRNCRTCATRSGNTGARREPADPGNAHGVPYLWSVTGIGYNTSKVLSDAPVEQPRALLFDPAIAKKLADCGIELLDTPQEVVPAALSWLGIDPKSPRPGRSRPRHRGGRERPARMCGASIPRNTSTILPPAISASRSAIRAM